MTPARGGRPIVHVVTNEWFMDTIGPVFEEAAPGRNVYAAVGFDPATLSVPRGADVQGIAADRPGLRRLDALVAGSAVSIFHNVSPVVAPALAGAPASTLRVWSGWGGDYYGTTFDRLAGLLGTATRRAVYGNVRPAFWVRRALDAARLDPLLRAAARATDVFSAPVPEDLDVFRRRFPGFRGRFGQLNYVTLEGSIATGTMPDGGTDILLGNAASPTNNHIEAIELLSGLALGDRRVIVPLSYGDPAYAAAVTQAGREMLGSRFVPIEGFLPLAEYNELLASCGVAVFAARRQEGLGNVLRAIWQGSTLVLDRRNPVATYLLTRGVTVNLLDEIGDGTLTAAVSPDQRAANAAFLENNWGRAAVVRNVERLLASA